MIRRHLADHGPRADRGFRWRGSEITRLEGFSDAVFAFAVTLLVVSLEVPHTFSELLVAMRGFVAFGICFACLAWVWYSHYKFFRRYGLQDGVTITLNAVLLFVVLFFVYPLKFVFTLVANQLFSRGAAGPLSGAAGEPAVLPGQDVALMAIYGLGYVSVCLVFAALYWRALAKRVDLGLEPAEVFDTWTELQAHLLDFAVGASSVAMVVLLGPRLVPWAGWVYFAIGPLRGTHGAWRGSLRRRLFPAAAGEPAVEPARQP